MLIIPASQQITSDWAGGTTTQLFIYPEGASYANRDFLFRISTATVETETSTFTSLPGFERILMILDGSMEICHKNHYSKHLYPFNTDIFNGDWETTAIGKVTDFNLMMASVVKGACNHELLESKQSLAIQIQSDFYGVYWLQGNALLRCGEEHHQLRNNDFILFDQEKTITILSEERSDWVGIEIDIAK